MIAKYDEFFEQEKKNAESRLNMFVAGKQMHEIVKQIIHFHDQKEANKHRAIFQMDNESQKVYKETKKQVYEFLDSLIETLNKEFGETTVTRASSKRDKINYLRRLSKELD